MNTGLPTVLDQRIEDVQGRARELQTSAAQARQEGSAEVQARIAQIRSDTAALRQRARDDAAQSGDRVRSQWEQFWADAAARMRGIQDNMDRKRDELDVKLAQTEARTAENEAVDALGFASWAIEQAEAAVLNAVDARAWADGRSAMPGS
jgi:hypothetical protein